MQELKEGWIELRGEVRLATTTVPSVNQMYVPNWRARCIYKAKEVADYQYNFEELARKTDLAQVKKYADNWEEIRVEFHFHLRADRKFWGLDVSNMVKATEDALVNLTTIDDSKHKSVYCEKYVSTDNFEKIEVIYRIKPKHSLVSQEDQELSGV